MLNKTCNSQNCYCLLTLVNNARTTEHTFSHSLLPCALLYTQCKNSWNSCQDLAYSYIFPFTLETLDKILFILASHKPLEILDRTLGKSLIKSVKRITKL